MGWRVVENLCIGFVTDCDLWITLLCQHGIGEKPEYLLIGLISESQPQLSEASRKGRLLILARLTNP